MKKEKYNIILLLLNKFNLIYISFFVFYKYILNCL